MKITPMAEMYAFLEDALSKNDKSVFDLIAKCKELVKQEEFIYREAYTQGANNELKLFVDDINEFLKKHLDALEIVTTFQKESEYLIGFKQALLMFQKEFEYILEEGNNEQ